jgi:uncharacterized protein YdgA (DUF945 family)
MNNGLPADQLLLQDTVFMSKSIGGKLLVGIVIVMLAAVLITPRVIGNSVEALTVESLLEMVPPEIGVLLTIPPPAVQTGWFSSQAEIEISFEPLDALTGRPVKVLLDMDIKHGPLLFTPNGVRFGLAYADITPTLSGMSVADIDPTLDFNDFKTQISMLAGFNNSLEMGIGLDEIQASDPNVAMALRGLQGSFLVNPDQSASSRFDMKTFSVTRPLEGYDVLVSDLQITAYQQSIAQVVSPGDVNLHIPSVSSTAPIPFSIENTDLSYQIEYSDTQQSLLNLTQSVSIDSMNWDIPLRSFSWTFSLNDINQTLIENYASLIEQAQLSGASDPLVVNTQLESLSMEFLLALLQEKLSLASAININAFEGDHALEVQLQWQGLAGLTDFNSLDINEAIRALDVSVALDADDIAINNSGFGSLLDQYKAEGLLVVNNGRVTMNATLNQEELTINGDVVPVDQIFTF